MLGLQLVGKFRLSNQISTNRVSAQKNLLFVAYALDGQKTIIVDDIVIDNEIEDVEDICH